MKLEIVSAGRDSAILIGDEDHNDIAEFYHNEHATVDQSYETALALARRLIGIEQRPIAWRCRTRDEPDWKYGESPLLAKDLFRKEPGFEEQPLYALSPASQPSAEAIENKGQSVSAIRSDKEAAITQERLSKLFSYDPLTGNVTKLVGPGRDKVLRTRNNKGYLGTKIGKRRFQLHRVIWMLVHGEWPPHLLDHRDGDKSNNALENLRLATPLQNVANMRLCSRNSTGFKGVVATREGKFKAFLHRDRKQIYLGTFATKEMAAAAYADAAKKSFGDFARLA